MGYSKIITLLTLLVLAAAVTCQVSQGGPHQSQGGPHESQGGPHESQGRTRRQAPQDGPESEAAVNVIAACANTTTTSLSCYDCTTRLICKPHSIVLVKCRDNVKPFCNSGICSSVLSPECS